jgi:site-specific DNA-methyltransferase (adenine-specific)
MDIDNYKNYKDKNGILINADCFDIMPLIEDKSIDLILADLPYGTTACKWDSILPLDLLWNEYKRIIKDNGAIVLTASQPFTTKLISSNYEMFKYDWVWNKRKATGHQLVKKQPLRLKEDILVFYKHQPIYNPQITGGKPYKSKQRKINKKGVYGQVGEHRNDNNGIRYPKNIIEFSFEQKPKHPTQKPVELMKYLIKTYTNENDMVLDNTMGSGTTCVASKELNRRFIGIEKEEKYFDIAVERINKQTLF